MYRDFYRNPIAPAHFYMQKVLPLVYDESLSYYEVVDKLVHKINEISCVTNKLVNDDLTTLVRRMLNQVFNDSLYVEDDEKIVLLINPVDDLIVNVLYNINEEKIVFNIRCKEEMNCE